MDTTHDVQMEIDFTDVAFVGDEPEEGAVFENLPGLSTKDGWKNDPFRDRSSDPPVQAELIKFRFSDEDFDGFSLMRHEIACAFAEERRHDKKVRYASPSFPKKKFKPDPQSQMILEQQKARQDRGRQFSIQDLDGATYGPSQHWTSKRRDGFIVENGAFPEEIA